MLLKIGVRNSRFERHFRPFLAASKMADQQGHIPKKRKARANSKKIRGARIYSGLLARMAQSPPLARRWSHNRRSTTQVKRPVS